MTKGGEISVVILTHHRPQFILESIRSALDQSHPPAEVIVVIDGPNDPSLPLIKELNEPRLRPVELQTNVGVASARNIGAAHAKHDWIAFLDDDDLWLPRKLELQLETAAQAQVKFPIVCARAIIRTGKVDLVWPRRFPRTGEPICEYLFRRSLPLYGEGAILSTSVLVRRELLQRVRFTDGLRRLDDIDWYLRVAREPEVKFTFPATDEPLLIARTDMGRPHASTHGEWRDSLEWGQARRHLFTRAAYAGFLCSNVSDRASRSNEPGVFLEILHHVRRYGHVSWVDMTSHVMNLACRQRRDMILKSVKKLGILR